MAEAAILKKNRVTDFDEIWNGDANWLRTGDISFQIPIFVLKKQDGSRYLEKPQKSRYRRSGLTDLREIWQDYAKLVSTSRPIKYLNFCKPRWRTAAILKTVKSPYFRNRLTDFEIWHGDADWPPAGDRLSKFRIFQKTR